MKNSFEIDAFLDKQEVQALSKFYQTLPKTINSGSENKAYTTGFPWASMPIKSIKNKLENVFSTVNVTVAMFLEEYIPWGVHTDYFKDDKSPFYAVLIPLEFEDKDTHTIIFNEQATAKNWKLKLTTDIGYEYTEQQLSLLNHIDQELLKKISIDSVYKWEKGKMIAWHRNYLHTSDNFKDTGMKKKIALVIFLNKDD